MILIYMFLYIAFYFCILLNAIFTYNNFDIATDMEIILGKLKAYINSTYSNTCHIYKPGAVASASYASGPEIDLHARHILSLKR